MTLTSTVFFAGWGGDGLGWEAVPHIQMRIAANHNPVCVQVHALNFPNAEHLPPGDVRELDLASLPATDLFWASPSCPAWTSATGEKRYFDQSNQLTLLDDELGVIEDPARARSRALMEQVPRYLEAMSGRGKPVLAGVVENVIQCRLWDQWPRWIGEIERLGYDTRVIALNSMHAMPRVSLRAPQSRDRLYIAYWLKSLGRQPDWDKWLRPHTYCQSCDQVVDAVQVFKTPGNEMGRYGIRAGQYVYRCPSRACRKQVVEPFVVPAAAAIDWRLPPGAKIGDRDQPLKPATIARIEARLSTYATGAFLAPVGGTWRTDAVGLDLPLPTRTTRETDGLVVPPLVVPTTARAGKRAVDAGAEPLPTQTCRRELAMVIPPFIAELRGGGCKTKARGVDQPLAAVTASGFHHGLVQPPGTPAWGRHLLVPYHRTATVRPLQAPLGTLTTKDRYGLLGVAVDPRAVPAAADCTFRMLDPTELRAGMAFPPTYTALGDKRTQARGYGNAVTPPVAEVIGCALVEAITGEDIERFPTNDEAA
jgi:DNA (cytosine-5)-methyltransferase 1